MSRSLVALSLTFAMGLFSATTAFAGSAEFLLDARTGRAIFAQNPDAPNHPASLTKMMTLYLTFEALKRGTITWDSPVPFSKYASSRPPTKLHVKPGDQITVREAVLGMIVLSANDAATAMAEKLGGTEEEFTRMMTQKARQLGMPNTYFVNACGLPDDRQITTARDMSALGLALIRDFPRDYQLFSTRSFAFRGRMINGHNNLMYRMKGVDGIKTGYTNASGYNLVTAYAEGNRRVIGVVMGGKSGGSRDAIMEKMITRNLSKAQGGNALIASAVPTGPILTADTTGSIPKTGDQPVTITADDVATPPMPAGSRFGAAYADGKSVNSAAAATEAMISGAGFGKSRANANEGEKGVTTPTPTQSPAAAMAASPRAATPATVTAMTTRPLKPYGLHKDGEWQIQIGASASAEAAMSLLQSVRDKIGGPLVDRDIYTEAFTQNGQTTYRARFTGFPSKDDAQAACDRLVKSSYDCVLMPARG